MTAEELSLLRELSQLYRLQTSYYDGLGVHRHPSPESILTVLESLGAPLGSFGDLPEALRQVRSSRRTAGVEPVLVKWGDDPFFVTLRRWEHDDSPVSFTLSLEGGETSSWVVHSDEPEQIGSEAVDGRTLLHYRYRMTDQVPIGYHTLALDWDSGSAHSTVIASPRQAVQGDGSRKWGIFVPAYAIRSRDQWSGSFTDLERTLRWVGNSGGRFVGTLPLFSTFLETPFAPSPYTPVSRLFWNEFFVDPRRAPGWSTCRQARELLGSEFQMELQALQRLPLVDYWRLMRKKRAVLELLCQTCFRDNGFVHEDYQTFLRKRKHLGAYAAFRAALEEQRGSVASPTPPECGDESQPVNSARQYHLFVQWLCETQLQSLLRTGREKNVGLYLDLPLGVHPEGFDNLRWPDSFAQGVSGGSPPDGFFVEGQDWGFRPLHPIKERRAGYRYLRSVLSHVMQHCQMIRIDHAMSLQRLFWVPIGAEAKEGVYVQYPMEEMFAVVTLESHRNGCVIVGEDLGTVTDEVRQEMERRGHYRMYVGQFEFGAGRETLMNPIDERMIASLNTHDTATASGFWHGDDIDLRVEMGLLSSVDAQEERKGRQVIRQAFMDYFGIEGLPLDERTQYLVFKALIGHLAAQSAEYLMISLEDLLQQRAPQNVPGTIDEKPNWRRRLTATLEDLFGSEEVLAMFQEINRRRESSDSAPTGNTG